MESVLFDIEGENKRENIKQLRGMNKLQNCFFFSITLLTKMISYFNDLV